MSSQEEGEVLLRSAEVQLRRLRRPRDAAADARLVRLSWWTRQIPLGLEEKNKGRRSPDHPSSYKLNFSFGHWKGLPVVESLREGKDADREYLLTLAMSAYMDSEY